MTTYRVTIKIIKDVEANTPHAAVEHVIQNPNLRALDINDIDRVEEIITQPVLTRTVERSEWA